MSVYHYDNLYWLPKCSFQPQPDGLKLIHKLNNLKGLMKQGRIEKLAKKTYPNTHKDSNSIVLCIVEPLLTGIVLCIDPDEPLMVSYGG